MKINEGTVKFQLDIWASINVLPTTYVSEEQLKNLMPSDITMIVYNKTRVRPIGKCRLMVRNPANYKKHNFEFVIVNPGLVPLLCKKTSEQMKLVKFNYEQISAVGLGLTFQRCF